MDTRTSMTNAPRGTTLLEIVICLVVLALVLGVFGEQVQGTIAAETMLSERSGADRLLGEVRALLTAEDPFSGPADRTYSTLDGVTATAAAAILCAEPGLPPDNGLESSLCANGERPVRRWSIQVVYPVTTGAGTSDTLRSTVDVASPASGSGWSTPAGDASAFAPPARLAQPAFGEDAS
jgi:hypothetical protein